MANTLTMVDNGLVLTWSTPRGATVLLVHKEWDHDAASAWHTSKKRKNWRGTNGLKDILPRVPWSAALKTC